MTDLTKSSGRCAVVIGSSIAGLLAARVLSDFYDDVLLIDRDALPDTPTPRKTVPQEHHVHLLLQRGQNIIERLLPGFMDELAEHGAIVVDLCGDVDCFQGDRWKRRWPSGITAHYSTRTLIEHRLRQRITSIPKVRVMSETVAQGLLFEKGGQRVSGVRLRNRSRSISDVSAELVIDATGRGSLAPLWLASAGYPVVETSEIVTQQGYVSGVYRPAADFSTDWTVLLCLPKIPRDRRMAVVSPIEGGRWMVTAGAWFDEQPEPDEQSLLAYLKALPIPDIHSAVSRARLEGTLHRYRMPGGLRRHYERMSRWPEGFLVLGDAVASINPLYSQGMSASALQVEALQDRVRSLRFSGDAYSKVQEAICEAASLPWAQAAAMEARFIGEKEPPKPGARLRTAYFDRLIAASASDRSVALALLQVNNLMADPKTLFSPVIALRALAAPLCFHNPTGHHRNATPPFPLPAYRF